MVTTKLAIHGGKIFKAVRGGVKILDAATMQWRFVSNTWYDGKLDEVFQNKVVRLKRPFKMPVHKWVVRDNFTNTVEKIRQFVLSIPMTEKETFIFPTSVIGRPIRKGDTWTFNH